MMFPQEADKDANRSSESAEHESDDAIFRKEGFLGNRDGFRHNDDRLIRAKGEWGAEVLKKLLIELDEIVHDIDAVFISVSRIFPLDFSNVEGKNNNIRGWGLDEDMLLCPFGFGFIIHAVPSWLEFLIVDNILCLSKKVYEVAVGSEELVIVWAFWYWFVGLDGSHLLDVEGGALKNWILDKAFLPYECDGR